MLNLALKKVTKKVKRANYDKLEQKRPELKQKAAKKKEPKKAAHSTPTGKVRGVIQCNHHYIVTH